MHADELKELDIRFTYHPPTSDAQREFYEVFRGLVRTRAMNLTTWLPDCRERSLAIKCLEEAVFWANAACARRGLQQERQIRQPSEENLTDAST